MLRSIFSIGLAVSLLTMAVVPAFAASSIGGGLHYLHNLGDLEEEDGYDKDAFGIIASYQYSIPLLSFEGNVEWVLDYLGSDKDLIEPSFYVVTNGLIYFGLGTGVGYIDDKWQSDPFYALRAGGNLSLGGLGLDLYATYRFQKDEDLEDLNGEDLDSMTFAGVLRKSF